MNRLIKVTLPKNIDKKYRYEFVNLNYYLSQLQVFHLSNVLITFEGTCLINNNLVKESVYGYRDKITIFSLTARLSLEFNTIFYHDSNHYLLVHSPIYSYYHWLTATIPRLYMVKSQIDKLILLLPVSLKNNSFIEESLAPFGINNIRYILKNTNIKVTHLVLPQIKPFFDSYYPEVVNEIREFYSNIVRKENGLKNEFKTRIFLTDKIENKHRIYNIKEVHSLLHKYDIINILDYSFYEQIQIMQNSNLIISPSGDDLACISFMKKGTSLLELFKEQTNEIDKPNLRYLNLASCLGIKYYYQFCSTTRNNHPGNLSKINVDISLLENNIELMCQ